MAKRITIPSAVVGYDPAANDYDLAKDPRCLFGWGPPAEKNPGTPRSCRCSWGHGCIREFGHRGKCWDGLEDDQPPCSRAQRPVDWDTTGRAEANA